MKNIVSILVCFHVIFYTWFFTFSLNNSMLNILAFLNIAVLLLITGIIFPKSIELMKKPYSPDEYYEWRYVCEKLFISSIALLLGIISLGFGVLIQTDKAWGITIIAFVILLLYSYIYLIKTEPAIRNLIKGNNELNLYDVM